MEVGIPRGIPCSTPGSRLVLGPPPPPPCGPPPLDLRLRAPLPLLPGLLLPIGERSSVSGGGSSRPGDQEEGSGVESMVGELQVGGSRCFAESEPGLFHSLGGARGWPRLSLKPRWGVLNLSLSLKIIL